MADRVVDSASVQLTADTQQFQQSWGETVKTVTKTTAAITAAVAAASTLNRALVAPQKTFEALGVAAKALATPLVAAGAALRVMYTALREGASITQAAGRGWAALLTTFRDFGPLLRQFLASWRALPRVIGSARSSLDEAADSFGALENKGKGLKQFFASMMGMQFADWGAKLADTLRSKINPDLTGLATNLGRITKAEEDAQLAMQGLINAFARGQEQAVSPFRLALAALEKQFGTFGQSMAAGLGNLTQLSDYALQGTGILLRLASTLSMVGAALGALKFVTEIKAVQKWAEELGIAQKTLQLLGGGASGVATVIRMGLTAAFKEARQAVVLLGQAMWGLIKNPWVAGFVVITAAIGGLVAALGTWRDRAIRARETHELLMQTGRDSIDVLNDQVVQLKRYGQAQQEVILSTRELLKQMNDLTRQSAATTFGESGMGTRDLAVRQQADRTKELQAQIRAQEEATRKALAGNQEQIRFYTRMIEEARKLLRVEQDREKILLKIKGWVEDATRAIERQYAAVVQLASAMEREGQAMMAAADRQQRMLDLLARTSTDYAGILAQQKQINAQMAEGQRKTLGSKLPQLMQEQDAARISMEGYKKAADRLEKGLPGLQGKLDDATAAFKAQGQVVEQARQALREWQSIGPDLTGATPEERLQAQVSYEATLRARKQAVEVAEKEKIALEHHVGKLDLSVKKQQALVQSKREAADLAAGETQQLGQQVVELRQAVAEEERYVALSQQRRDADAEVGKILKESLPGFRQREIALEKEVTAVTGMEAALAANTRHVQQQYRFAMDSVDAQRALVGLAKQQEQVERAAAASAIRRLELDRDRIIVQKNAEITATQGNDKAIRDEQTLLDLDQQIALANERIAQARAQAAKIQPADQRRVELIQAEIQARQDAAMAQQEGLVKEQAALDVERERLSGRRLLAGMIRDEATQERVMLQIAQDELDLERRTLELRKRTLQVQIDLANETVRRWEAEAKSPEYGGDPQKLTELQSKIVDLKIKTAEWNGQIEVTNEQLSQVPSRVAAITDEYSRMHEVTLKIGDTVADTVSGMLHAWRTGQGSFKDIMKGFKETLIGQFEQGFNEILKRKFRSLDIPLFDNFTKDLPAMAGQGVSSIAQMFTNLGGSISGIFRNMGNWVTNLFSGGGTGGGGGLWNWVSSLFSRGGGGGVAPSSGGGGIWSWLGNLFGGGDRTGAAPGAATATGGGFWSGLGSMFSNLGSGVWGWLGNMFGGGAGGAVGGAAGATTSGLNGVGGWGSFLSGVGGLFKNGFAGGFGSLLSILPMFGTNDPGDKPMVALSMLNTLTKLPSYLNTLSNVPSMIASLPSIMSSIGALSSTMAGGATGGMTMAGLGLNSLQGISTWVNFLANGGQVLNAAPWGTGIAGTVLGGGTGAATGAATTVATGAGTGAATGASSISSIISSVTPYLWILAVLAGLTSLGMGIGASVKARKYIFPGDVETQEKIFSKNVGGTVNLWRDMVGFWQNERLWKAFDKGGWKAKVGSFINPAERLYYQLTKPKAGSEQKVAGRQMEKWLEYGKGMIPGFSKRANKELGIDTQIQYERGASLKEAYRITRERYGTLKPPDHPNAVAESLNDYINWVRSDMKLHKPLFEQMRAFNISWRAMLPKFAGQKELWSALLGDMLATFRDQKVSVETMTAAVTKAIQNMGPPADVLKKLFEQLGKKTWLTMEDYTRTIAGMSEVWFPETTPGVRMTDVVDYLMEGKGDPSTFDELAEKGKITFEELKKAVEQFNAAAAMIAPTFQAAIEAAAAQVPLSDVHDQFMTGIKDALKKAVLEGWTSGIMEATLKPVVLVPFGDKLKEIMEDLRDGEITSAEAVQRVRDLVDQTVDDVAELGPVIDEAAEGAREIGQIFDESPTFEALRSGFRDALQRASEGISIPQVKAEFFTSFRSSWAEQVREGLLDAATAALDPEILDPYAEKLQDIFARVRSGETSMADAIVEIRNLTSEATLAFRQWMPAISASVDAARSLWETLRASKEELQAGFVVSLSDNFADAVSNGLSAALAEGSASTKGLKDFAASIGGFLQSAIMGALQQAFLNSALIQGLLAPLQQSMASAMAQIVSGGLNADNMQQLKNAVAIFAEGLVAIMPQLAPIFEQIQAAMGGVAKVFGLPTPEETARQVAINERLEALSREAELVQRAADKRLSGLQREIDLMAKWRAVQDAAKDAIDSIRLGELGGLTGYEQLALAKTQAGDLMARFRDAKLTPTERTAVGTELATLLQSILSIGSTVYQKQSPEFKALREWVLTMLGELEAEGKSRSATLESKMEESVEVQRRMEDHLRRISDETTNLQDELYNIEKAIKDRAGTVTPGADGGVSSPYYMTEENRQKMRTNLANIRAEEARTGKPTDYHKLLTQILGAKSFDEVSQLADVGKWNAQRDVLDLFRAIFPNLGDNFTAFRELVAAIVAKLEGNTDFSTVLGFGDLGAPNTFDTTAENREQIKKNIKAIMDQEAATGQKTAYHHLLDGVAQQASWDAVRAMPPVGDGSGQTWNAQRDVVDLFRAIWPNIGDSFSAFQVLVSHILNKLSGSTAFDPILGFERGGRVPGRPGEPQLAIVHGGEVIVPLRRIESSRGLDPSAVGVTFTNSMPITIHVPPGTKIDEKRLADQVAATVQQNLEHSIRYGGRMRRVLTTSFRGLQ